MRSIPKMIDEVSMRRVNWSARRRPFFGWLLMTWLLLGTACSSSPGSSPTPEGSGTPGSGTPGSGTPAQTPTLPPGVTPTLAPNATPTPRGTSTPAQATPTSTPANSIAYCAKSCSKVADCVPSSSTPLTDADNWSCTNQVCAGHGCNNTKECTSTYNSSSYECASVTYSGVSDGGTGYTTTCVKTCRKAADCSLGVPAYDSDNYSCDNGLCQYVGCTSDRECSTGYVCAKGAGFDVPYCLPGCKKASDCASTLPAYDADNYACTDGLCSYTGCNSNQECSSSSSPGYTLDTCVGK